jgi:hypothetical protein
MVELNRAATLNLRTLEVHMKRFGLFVAVVIASLVTFALSRAMAATATGNSPAVAPHAGLPGDAKPLVSGSFVSGTIWEKPLTSSPGSNTGCSPAAGSRVDVYDHFIVVTNAEGISEISQHGSYTNLRFKPYNP